MRFQGSLRPVPRGLQKGTGSKGHWIWPSGGSGGGAGEIADFEDLLQANSVCDELTFLTRPQSTHVNRQSFNNVP